MKTNSYSWTRASKNSHFPLVCQNTTNNYTDHVSSKQSNYIETYTPSTQKDACGVGIYANLNGTPCNDILKKSLTMLARMDHRGATASDPLTSDGVGIQTDIPHKLFSSIVEDLPQAGQYGVGFIYIPNDLKKNSIQWKESISLICYKEGFRLLNWRS